MGAENIKAVRAVNKWNPIWLVLPGLLVSLVLYWFYNSLAQPQVPYMDSMLYIAQVEKILKGEITWWNVYGSGEHRGLIFPLVLLAEWYFWAVDSRITTLLTGGVVAATFFYWLRSLVLVRYEVFGESYLTIKVLILSIVAAVVIVSPAAFELWTLDLGFAQLIKNLLIVAFFYQLSIARFWEKSLAYALLFGAWGGFLILFATYGWSYPFLAAVIFAFICLVSSERGVWVKSLAVLIPMLLAQYCYMRLGQGVFSNNEYGAQGVTILGFAKAILFGAGSCFIGSEIVSKSNIAVIWPMLLGGLLLGCAGVALLRTFITPTPVRLFAGALLAFSITVLAGVALARGANNYLNTGASRYFVDYVWLLLAPVLIFSKSSDSLELPSLIARLKVFSLQRIYSAARILMFALIAIALLGHLRTWQVEVDTAPYRAVVFKNMAEVYVKGVTSEADAALLQASFPVAKEGVDVAQRYMLSVNNRALHCNLKNAEYSGDWFSPEKNSARWMGPHGEITLGNCAREVYIKGYIPENFRPRDLYISYLDKKAVISLEPGKEFVFQLEGINKARVVVTLNVDHITTPLLEGIGADQRELGILLTGIGN